MDHENRNGLVDILFRDLFEHLRSLLKKNGYHIEEVHIDNAGPKVSDRALRVAQLYYDKRDHRLQPRKRSVLRSSVLNNKIANAQTHGISLSDIQAIMDIENNSTLGRDLFAYYNKNVGRLATGFEKQDKLFNEWNILHFHLGTKRQDQSGFIERTKNVLLLYPANDHLLFIDVRSHDLIDPEPWFDKKYIEIIHNEWPNFIVSHLAPRVRSISPATTEDSVKAFRGESEEQKLAAKKAHSPYTMSFTTAIQLDDGTVYHQLGDGLASHGMRMMTVRRSLHIMRQVSTFAREIYDEEHARVFVKQQARMAVNNPTPRIRIVGKTLWECKIEFFEEKSGTVLAECIL